MHWFFLAIIGHVTNAVAFVIDKALLRTAFKLGATYAALIGTLSFVVIAASPWVGRWPTGDVLLPTAGFGILFVIALWSFFEALRRGEASRIVPITGSLIPLLTLAGTTALLGEKFTATQGWGFLLLLVATVLLTGTGNVHSRLTFQAAGFSVLAAFLFAAASVAGKIAFAQGGFLGVFVLSRIFAGATGLFLGLLHAGARLELLQILRPSRASSARASGVWAVVGQCFGAGGFLLVNLALAQGSAPLVNALQAVQYAAIVIVAWFGGRRLRAILREERSLSIMLVKSSAVALVAFGLWLLSA